MTREERLRLSHRSPGLAARRADPRSVPPGRRAAGHRASPLRRGATTPPPRPRAPALARARARRRGAISPTEGSTARAFFASRTRSSNRDESSSEGSTDRTYPGDRQTACPRRAPCAGGTCTSGACSGPSRAAPPPRARRSGPPTAPTGSGAGGGERGRRAASARRAGSAPIRRPPPGDRGRGTASLPGACASPAARPREISSASGHRRSRRRSRRRATGSASPFRRTSPRSS